MRPPIHSKKHYRQMSLTTVITGTRNVEDLIHAVETPTAVNQVVEGAVVKAIYVELWMESSSADGFQIVTLLKDTQDNIGPTFAEMSALGDYNNKKNILFTHQGLSSNDGVGNPMLVMRGWYKIPKSKQRFGLGDKINLSISNPSSNTNTYCGFATYKEYT